MNIQKMIDRQNERAGTCAKLQYGKDVDELPERFLVGIRYACPTCEKMYDTEHEAMQCRDQLYDTAGLNVGDVVVIPNSNFYTPPAEGYEHWCAFHIPGSPGARSHFDHDGQWFPYYIVSAIHPEERDPHRCVVTVVTLFSGEVYGGWNPADGDGHHSMFHPGHKRAEQHSDTGSTWWESKRHGKTFGSRIVAAEPSSALLTDAKEIASVGISTEKLL